MTRMWIVVGDTTSGGGAVVSGSPFTDIDGKPAARKGDKVICGTHGPTTIATGDPTLIIDGEAQAMHGDSCACGCKLISTQQMRVFASDGGGGGGGSAGAGAKAAATPASQQAVAAAATAAAETSSEAQYDEQVQFYGPTGAKLSNLRYVLHLDDGQTIEGTSDDEGRTQRVATSKPQKVVKAELAPASDEVSCCAQGVPAQTTTINISDVSTHARQIGVSTASVRVEEAEDRSLTAGEIALLRKVFAESIDYSTVKIHHHGYWMFFGLQSDDTATAPNGEIYFPSTLFSEDFASEPDDRKRLLVHEMTHVWQYQLGYPIKRVRAPRPNMAYEYTLTVSKKLCDYNMEAQGNIVADYFLVKHRNNQRDIYETKYRRFSSLLPLYEDTLRDFLANPADPVNLPLVTE